METLHQIIETAKVKTKSETDGALAREMGVTHASVSHWRSGRSTPDSYALMELQRIIGIDARQLLAIIEAERAKTEERRGYWEGVKKSFSQSGSTIVTVAFAATLALVAGPDINTAHNVYYVKLANSSGLFSLLPKS